MVTVRIVVSYRKLYLVGKITFPCPLNPVYRPHGSGGAARLSGPNLDQIYGHGHS